MVDAGCDCWRRCRRTILSCRLRALLWMDLAPWNAALMAHGWPTTHLAPTLDLNVQFLPHLYAATVTSSVWLLAETHSPIAGDGLFAAQSKLWSESGRLVAGSAAQALCVSNPRYAEQRRRLSK
ncbi:MAG: thioesterase family protein [Rhodospirillales bacterium]|nr:thioesterase family protein [Rhodospirillales bacterium]